jgi:hypothetical protein
MNNIPVSSEWTAGGPNAPENAVEFGESVYLFSSGLAQTISLFIKIPQTYIPLNQIFMYLSFYSPSTTGQFLFQTNAYLIRRGLDSMGSTLNFHNSTNQAIPNSGVANQNQQATLDLTDTGGLISSVQVSPGDLINVVLSRGNDSDGGTVRFVPSSTEVAYV